MSCCYSAVGVGVPTAAVEMGGFLVDPHEERRNRSIAAKTERCFRWQKGENHPPTTSERSVFVSSFLFLFSNWNCASNRLRLLRL